MYAPKRVQFATETNIDSIQDGHLWDVVTISFHSPVIKRSPGCTQGTLNQFTPKPIKHIWCVRLMCSLWRQRWATLMLWGKTADIPEKTDQFLPPSSAPTNKCSRISNDKPAGRQMWCLRKQWCKISGFSFVWSDLFIVLHHGYNNRTSFWVICLNTGSPEPHRHIKPSSSWGVYSLTISHHVSIFKKIVWVIF